MSVRNFKLLTIVCAIVTLVALFFSVPSFAGLGKIAGTVTDEQSGEPLHGGQILIVGTEMGAATDDQGKYYILNIPPGKYTVKVTFMGYVAQEIENVRSQQDVTTELSVKLKSPWSVISTVYCPVKSKQPTPTLPSVASVLVSTVAVPLALSSSVTVSMTV